MNNVISLPNRTQLLSKKQLAKHLNRSERWIELAVRDRGMPVEDATDHYGRRRYDLAKVDAWLAQGTPKPSRPSLEARVSSLEAQLRELVRRSA